MIEHTQVTYTKPQAGKKTILVADIGGTNTNVGVLQIINDQIVLLVVLHFKSKVITDFAQFLSEVVAHVQTTFNLSISAACLCAAGAISQDRATASLTNLPVTLDRAGIAQKIGVPVYLVNDFEIIGYGIPCVNSEQKVLVKSGKPQEKQTLAIIGAGTGLGKSIMVWNNASNSYLSCPSEGGHADFAAQNELDLEFMEFLKNNFDVAGATSWEDVLAGQGIIAMYQFFKNKNKNQKTDPQLAEYGLMPDDIFGARTLDEHARNTCTLYTMYSARCVKNFALETLARSGVYIVGGIASKNVQLYQQESFATEFVNCRKHVQLLQQIPVYVITDYNVTLYGGAAYISNNM